MRCALVVDDSKFMRTVVGNELRENGYEVVEASNGKQALEAVEVHEPDVITMDVAMPVMDGIEAVERIMNWRPTPILMVSAYTADGADATLDALQKGAVGFIQKPGGEVSIETRPLEDELIEKVEAAVQADAEALSSVDTATEAGNASDAGSGADEAADATGAIDTSTEATESAAETVTAETRAVDAAAEAVEAATQAVKAATEATGADTTPEDEPASTPPVELPPRPGEQEDPSRDLKSSLPERLRAADYVDYPTIVIGASTGGPKILNNVLQTLPRELGARVLVVQHMPASFTDRFALRLNGVSDYEIAEAQDGERIGPGQVRVARGDCHLKVVEDSGGRLTLELIEDQLSRSVRPAIDVTMETAAAAVERPLTAVALTGMGSDGAAGIRAVKEAGGTTIVQDEETSPVFGIPQKAIETGCVDQVLAAEDIVEGVLETFTKEGD